MIPNNCIFDPIDSRIITYDMILHALHQVIISLDIITISYHTVCFTDNQTSVPLDIVFLTRYMIIHPAYVVNLPYHRIPWAFQ